MLSGEFISGFMVFTGVFGIDRKCVLIVCHLQMNLLDTAVLPAFAAKDWLNTRYKAEEILAHANLNVVSRSLMPEQISMDI